MTGPEPSPSVTTAPAEGASPGTASPPGRRRRLPPHLGPARTSTVLLALAFLAIGVLYLFVKPPDPARTAGSVTDPSPTTSRSGAPVTEAPAPEGTEAPTSEVAPTTSEPPPRS